MICQLWDDCANLRTAAFKCFNCLSRIELRMARPSALCGVDGRASQWAVWARGVLRGVRGGGEDVACACRYPNIAGKRALKTKQTNSNPNGGKN